MAFRSNERLKPSEIRFIQESIASKFQNGEYIHDAITSIQHGTLSPDNFPPIKVVRKEGKFYSFDNRRLYVFRVCEYRGYVTDIPVIIMPLSRLIDDRVTTENDGIKVRVRRGMTETHYSDRWLREKDDRGNKNLPPQRTTGKVAIKTDTVDGVLPMPFGVPNRSSRNNDASLYHKSSVYTISRPSNPQLTTKEMAISPPPQPWSSITSQRVLANNKPPETSSTSEFYEESYADVLSRYLRNSHRSTHSRNLQVAANYGSDNRSFIPADKPSIESTRSKVGLPKQPSIKSQRPTTKVSRKKSSPSSKRSMSNAPVRNISDRTKTLPQSESLRVQPSVQTGPRPGQEDVLVTKTSLFRRFLRLCCCCCVRDTD